MKVTKENKQEVKILMNTKFKILIYFVECVQFMFY